MNAIRSLRAIKLLHTLIWAFFAASVFAIPVCALLGHYTLAALFSAVVFVEVLVLIFNRLHCPLTAVAARYTDDRRANFDIYLPEWLARYNKQIFGVAYLAGMLFALGRWAGWL